jgi:hypothetical protein
MMGQFRTTKAAENALSGCRAVALSPLSANLTPGEMRLAC